MYCKVLFNIYIFVIQNEKPVRGTHMTPNRYFLKITKMNNTKKINHG